MRDQGDGRGLPCDDIPVPERGPLQIRLSVADARYCFGIPDLHDDGEAAALLCAGLIGCRGLRIPGPAARIGLYGFGAAAHIIAQVAISRRR